MNHFVFAAFCAWLLATEAAAAPLVTGTVTARNGTPLAEVTVQVELRTARTSTPTDAQGMFRFDAATLFPAADLRDASGLMLKFSKPGYQPANKLLRLVPGQAPAPVTIQLDAAGGSTALDAAEKQTLDKFAPAPGSTPLYLIPYALTGVTVPEPKSVNDALRANLERVIVTHVQASTVGGSPSLSLKLLPVERAGDVDRLRAYGTYLNALGVITGYGAVEPSAGGARSLVVSSTFLVVPQAEAVGAPVLYVDDDMPADSLASPRLYKRLSKLWGRSTVLALGISEFGKAKAARDKDALARIRKYLQAERAAAGPGDEALVSQLNALVEAVDKELAK
jgi:hypothetical protein